MLLPSAGGRKSTAVHSCHPPLNLQSCVVPAGARATPARLLSAAQPAPTADRLRLPVRFLAYSVLSACFARSAAAKDCAIVESRASLGELSGAQITSVDVVSDGPYLPGPAHWFSVLHPVSREEVIRRQLLFAPGDTVDSILVGETLRRLRAQKLFADAVILARRCDGEGGVALSVSTRDTWTLRPTARLRSANQLSIGVEDKNFLGTGRAVSLTREMTLRGNGAAVSISDPFIFGSSLAGNFRLANLAGGHTLRLGLRNHEYSVFDPWRGEGNISRLSYGDTLTGERALHTIAAMLLMGRRIGSDDRAVTRALVGVEFDSAASVSPSRRIGITAGMPHVRSYVGANVGFQRRTAQFDTASWIVPGRGFLDVPIGWESETLIGGGYERDAKTPTAKVDTWVGRVFLPTRTQVLLLDAWTSAYIGRSVDRNQITRASASWYSDALRGMWGARLTLEELRELDPDRRGLSLMGLADYTSPLLRQYAVWGGRSVAASVERDVHLFQVGAASVVNAGAFLAGSYRARVRNMDYGDLQATVIGARLRVLSANGAIASTRIDVGFPITHSDVLSRKPFVTITYGALFDASRQRDGRRIY